MKRALLTLGLLAASCNHQASLEEWCTHTAQCLCTAEVCCVQATFECSDEAPCCVGGSCQAGRCQPTDGGP